MGRDFAGYRIEEQIGQGGIGVVYRAHDPKLGRAVALKLLRVDAVGPSQRPRFEREAKALAALKHPNIVSILDCGVSDSVPYLVMELLDGQTLSQALDKPLERTRAKRIMRELLSALAYVHEQGLVHRDLKPGNIFLQRLPGGGEQAKLLDFGLAKFIAADGQPDTTLTRTGEVFGTPAYMPPEQWSGDKVDASADVYSAATVCFEMLAGRRPFMSEGQELLRAQLVDPPPFLHEACADRVARPELERALQKALSKRARDRQPNAAELEEQLEAVPEPWCYEGKEVTEERKLAAQAARDDMHMAMAPDVVRPGAVDSNAKTILRVKEPVASRPVRKISLIRALLSKLLLLGAWTLSLVSLVVIGVAATLIYLSRDSANPEARLALERALPKVRDAVERGKSVAKDAVNDAVVSAAEKVSAALPEQADAGVAAQTPTQTKAPPRSAPRVRAVNPWKQQPIPRELRQHRWKLEIGQEGDRDMIKELKRYSRARGNTKDPRANLLLARLYANRDAWNDAVSHYKIAFERDPSSRGDPRMLKDLVLAVAEKESSWRASELIPVIYGPEALAEIKRVTSRTHDNEERLRLEQLAHTLAP